MVVTKLELIQEKLNNFKQFMRDIAKAEQQEYVDKFISLIDSHSVEMNMLYFQQMLPNDVDELRAYLYRMAGKHNISLSHITDEQEAKAVRYFLFFKSMCNNK